MTLIDEPAFISGVNVNELQNVTITVLDQVLGLELGEDLLEMEIPDADGKMLPMGELVGSELSGASFPEELKKMHSALLSLGLIFQEVMLTTTGQTKGDGKIKPRANPDEAFDRCLDVITNLDGVGVRNGEFLVNLMRKRDYVFPSGVRAAEKAEFLNAKHKEAAQKIASSHFKEIYGVERGAFVGEPYALALISGHYGDFLRKHLSDQLSLFEGNSGSKMMVEMRGRESVVNACRIPQAVYDAWKIQPGGSRVQPAVKRGALEYLTVIPTDVDLTCLLETMATLFKDGRNAREAYTTALLLES